MIVHRVWLVQVVARAVQVEKRTGGGAGVLAVGVVAVRVGAGGLVSRGAYRHLHGLLRLRRHQPRHPVQLLTRAIGEAFLWVAARWWG